MTAITDTDWPNERIGLYTRLSHDHKRATSIERQDEEAREVINLKGGVVYRVYCDPDMSAWREEVHRPDFDRLLADAAVGDITLAVVWAFDRLTRNGEHTEAVLKLMRKTGLKLYSVKEGQIDTNSGAIFAKLLGWKGEQESERISVRIKSANRKLARAGQPHPGGKRGYGHRRTHQSDGTAYLAAEHLEAEVIRDAAAKVMAGESLRSIAADLNRRQVPTATGGLWRGGNLNQLLRQPRIGGFRERDGELYTANGNGGGIEPLLEPDQWKRLRSVLADPARTRAESRAAKHLLTGLLRCGTCGSRMITSSTRGRRTYRCQGVVTPEACGKVSIDGERLEAVVAEEWIAALDGSELPQAVAALVGDHRDLSEENAILRERLEEAVKARFVEGELSPADYTTVRRELEARIATNDRIMRRSADGERLTALAGQAANTWSYATLEQRRVLLRLLLDRITIAPSQRTGRFEDSRVSIAWRS